MSAFRHGSNVAGTFSVISGSYEIAGATQSFWESRRTTSARKPTLQARGPRHENSSLLGFHHHQAGGQLFAENAAQGAVVFGFAIEDG